MAKKETGSGLLKSRWLGRKKTRDEEKFTEQSLIFLIRHTILAGLQYKYLDEYVQEKYPTDKRFPKIKKQWSDVKVGIRVSIYKNGNLRGSKGSLESKTNVYDDVLEYTKTAAFKDERFPKINGKEFRYLEFEVTIIENERIPIEYKDPMELLVILGKSKDMGVMVKKDKKSSYFLSDTWDLIPEPGMFMSSLCLSADLPASSWRGQKRIWPSKRTELRRDLYTGKIVKPSEWGRLEVLHIPCMRIKGRGNTLKDV